MDLAARVQWAVQQPVNPCHVGPSIRASCSRGGDGGSPNLVLLSSCATSAGFPRFPARTSPACARSSAASAPHPRPVVVFRAGSRPLASPGRRKRVPVPVALTVTITEGWGLGLGEAGSVAGSGRGSAWGRAGSAGKPAGWVNGRKGTVAAAAAVSLAGDGSNLDKPMIASEMLTQQKQEQEQEQGRDGAAGAKGVVEGESKGGGESGGGRESVGVEEVLERMRSAVRIECLAADMHVHVTGVQSLMGMEGTWQLLVSPAGGRFVESFVGRHIWSVSGFAGQSETSESDSKSSISDAGSWNADGDKDCNPVCNTVWDIDTAGRVSALDLDDHEVYLLSVWLRSSLWLLPPVASSALDIRIVGDGEGAGEEGREGQRKGEGEEEGDKVMGAEREGSCVIPNGMRMEIDAHVAAQDRVILAMNLTGREVTMYVAVHRSDWLPRVAVVKAYGALETFTFSLWAPVAPDCEFLLPATVHRETSAGAQQTFSAARTSVLPPGQAHIVLREREGIAAPGVTAAAAGGFVCADGAADGPSEESTARTEDSYRMPFAFSYHMPATRTVPSPLSSCPEASFDESAAAEVDLYQSNSGHLLVRPLINGQDVGYFILDSGASCFTIEPAVADSLGLASFGCVHTVTVHGPAECAFRRADSVQLGPLHIANALFVDVGGAALVQGVKPVVGICGYDVFRHAVVHVQARGRKGTLRLYKPQETEPSAPEPRASSTAAGSTESRTGKPSRGESGPERPADGPVPPGVAMAQRRGRGGGAGGRTGGGVAVVSAALVGGHPSVPDLGAKIYWEPIRMLGSVPHITITFQEHWDSPQQQGLFLLDTGAAGVDIIFNSRAVQRCQLGTRAKGGDSWLKGMGGAGGGGDGQQMTVRQGNLAIVTIAGQQLKNVAALFSSAEQGALELSQYTSGLICRNLLSKFDLIIDYPGLRVGLIPRSSRMSKL
ncbi:hypothetical protein CLOM_g2886 [Closterium sp. NIES-68]|nr:hypothetical protein CLOM_g2886 [Closterium sp. NIES-68]GJP69461.1 hypothetical protein CLOP_g474 [Closterium sp. NIES-67]GJP75744.1 hypothetical protein CLOP_g6150 [Closterium sp. NIES-67]